MRKQSVLQIWKDYARIGNKIKRTRAVYYPRLLRLIPHLKKRKSEECSNYQNLTNICFVAFTLIYVSDNYSPEPKKSRTDHTTFCLPRYFTLGLLIMSKRVNHGKEVLMLLSKASSDPIAKLLYVVICMFKRRSKQLMENIVDLLMTLKLIPFICWNKKTRIKTFVLFENW